MLCVSSVNCYVVYSFIHILMISASSICGCECGCGCEHKEQWRMRKPISNISGCSANADVLRIFQCLWTTVFSWHLTFWIYVCRKFAPCHQMVPPFLPPVYLIVPVPNPFQSSHSVRPEGRAPEGWFPKGRFFGQVLQSI